MQQIISQSARIDNFVVETVIVYTQVMCATLNKIVMMEVTSFLKFAIQLVSKSFFYLYRHTNLDNLIIT